MNVILWLEMCLPGQGGKEGEGALCDKHRSEALFLPSSQPFITFLALRYVLLSFSSSNSLLASLCLQPCPMLERAAGVHQHRPAFREGRAQWGHRGGADRVWGLDPAQAFP